MSNGDQTRTAVDALVRGGSFEAALATREREPDAPHYTPRISALLDLTRAAPALALSILRASDADPAATDRTSFRPAPPPAGFGLGAHHLSRATAIRCRASGAIRSGCPSRAAPRTSSSATGRRLDAGNRVALAVKRIPAAGGPSTILVRNRFA